VINSPWTHLVLFVALIAAVYLVSAWVLGR
jgi:hypothetical protein